MAQDKAKRRLPYVSEEVYDRIRMHCILNKIEVQRFTEDAVIEKLDRDTKVSREETFSEQRDA